MLSRATQPMSSWKRYGGLEKLRFEINIASRITRYCIPMLGPMSAVVVVYDLCQVRTCRRPKGKKCKIGFISYLRLGMGGIKSDSPMCCLRTSKAGGTTEVVAAQFKAMNVKKFDEKGCGVKFILYVGVNGC